MIQYGLEKKRSYGTYEEALKFVEQLCAHDFDDSFLDSPGRVCSPRPRYLIQSNPKYESLNERRREFFAELLTTYGYHHNQIALNVAVPGQGTDQAVDLMLYEDEERKQAHCAIDFAPLVAEADISSRTDSMREIVQKARCSGARYAAYITPHDRLYLDVELWSENAPTQALVAAFPV